jgi:exodeoxyribonuclease V alpha subunit
MNPPTRVLSLPYDQLPAIDRILTEHILRSFGISDDIEPIILYLVSASRNGHLCCEVKSDQLNPDPTILWGEGAWSDRIIDSFKTLCRLPDKITETKIKIEANRLYLLNNWIKESEIREAIEKLRAEPPRLEPDINLIRSEISELLTQKKLEPEQAKAIEASSQNAITLISGGPGTGKTYTAGMVIKTLLKALGNDRQIEVSLAAPTGKAASQLQLSITTAMGPSAQNIRFDSKTLHALLGRKKQGKTATFLSSDIILVDESSMIDAGLLLDLLKARKEGSRLILLGDPHQLPPIESGSLFADLIQMQLPGAHLKKCLRAEMAELIEFATLINLGNHTQAWESISKNGSNAPVYLYQNDPINLAIEKYPTNFHLPIEVLLTEFQKFRILTPLNQGKLGVEGLNQTCRDRFVAKAKDRFILPIMITTNDYRLGLFNGEIGLLEMQPPFDRIKPGDIAYFFGGEKEALRRFPALTLPTNQTAYALSVHKSQGSEFSEVLLVLPEGSESFGREVVYTGVTRAKRSVALYTTQTTFNAALSKRSHRISGLTDCYLDKPQIVQAPMSPC